MFNNINFGELTYIIMGMTLFIISGSVHEFSHAFSAYILGDDTAKFNGRLTVNPLAHVDIFGTIIFPLISVFTGLRLLGWMRPVPVNPGNFKNPSKGHAITSFAGPFSNLMQASFGLILIKIIFIVYSLIIFKNESIFNFIFLIAYYYININITLMIFNLLPVPPLDGGWILRHFLPHNLRDKFDNIYRFGIIILYAILLSGLLRIIFTPFDLALEYLFSNIHNINIFVIMTPFLAGLLLIYFFLKDEISALVKRKKFTANYKQGEKELNKKLIETKKENLALSDKLQDILKKIQNKMELDKKDKDFLEKISINSLNGSKLCQEIDFSIDDTHCNECEYFINCLLRNMRKEQLFNKLENN